MSVTIPECSACGLPAVYQCIMTDDQYCTKHKRECCNLMKFPEPKPRFSWEGKLN